MGKKAKIFNSVNKDRIITAVSILSFIGMAVLWVSFISFAHYSNEQNRINAEQFFKLGIQSTQQQYCIDNSVKPCTQEAINTHAESTSSER